MGEIIENEYGKIEILEKVADSNKVKFKCFCGNIHETQKYRLKSGSTKSCGCSRIGNHIGKKAGKLTVIKFVKNKGWYCSCSCGGFRYTQAGALNKGLAKSCGCIKSSEGDQLYKSIIHNRWCSLLHKRILSEEFKDFKIFENYINNELKAPDKKFRIYRIDETKLVERGNVKLYIIKHKKIICDIEYVWCGSCEKYIQNSDKFWENKKEDNKSSCNPCKYKKIIKRKFNLEYKDYLEMIKKCNRSCEICKRSLSFLTSDKTACIDHCHKTNKVRGILCKNCNNALGLFEDNIELMKRTIIYLNKGDTEHKYNKYKKIKINDTCPITDLSENLVCDHNHSTGFVRGNINSNINFGIGLLKDSVKNLENAIIYLERFKNEQYNN